jgi:peptidoglycan/xylan/chitin deacetylase (PgdA/CDA1 family)
MQNRFFRRCVLAKLVLACLLIVPAAHARSIAFTFDDGPDMADGVRMTAAERNAAILRQLADAKVKSVLFVTHTDRDERRSALLRQWGSAGHMIGNHTVTHPDFNSKEMTLEKFQQDMLACDEAIRTLPGYTRIFRFPYLKEGDTVEKRDGFRAFLKSVNYRTGHVSIDMSDWYYNSRLRERLSKDPGADLNPYRDAYLEHVYDRAQYYDGLSQKVLGRSVLHVILMHHNLINALFLHDVIRMFRDKGWQVIDAKIAFADPVYHAEPDTLPAGESILWALAKQKNVPGLRWPAEDDIYEKPILDRLHL